MRWSACFSISFLILIRSSKQIFLSTRWKKKKQRRTPAAGSWTTCLLHSIRHGHTVYFDCLILVRLYLKHTAHNSAHQHIPFYCVIYYNERFLLLLACALLGLIKYNRRHAPTPRSCRSVCMWDSFLLIDLTFIFKSHNYKVRIWKQYSQACPMFFFSSCFPPTISYS